MAYVDLSGQIFQNLRVLEQAEDYVSPKGIRERMWSCECLLCGKIITTRERNLKSGHIKSCGRKHRQFENLSGKEFGDLTVIERVDNVISGRTTYVMYRCKCKCGREVVVRASALKSGHTKSCGICSRSSAMMGKGLDDITGREFGYWKVLGISRSLIQPNGRRVTLWKCQCRCGEIREIRAGTLKQGLSYSCGCHKSEVLREKAAHGFGVSRCEKLVSDYLKNCNIYYESQVIYPDLRGDSGYPLSYDFLVYKNFEPCFLIECQGKQHYEFVEFFGGDKRFDVQKKNDDKKREYACQIKVPLLEIPYWCSDEEVVQLLSDKFGNA